MILDFVITEYFFVFWATFVGMNWNRSDFLWILDRLLWVLFFEGERGEKGKGFMVLFEFGKMMVNDSWWHWILHGTKKKNYFEHFCIIKASSCIFFSFLFFFNFEQDTWIAIRTEGIRCISCIKGISSV